VGALDQKKKDRDRRLRSGNKILVHLYRRARLARGEESVHGGNRKIGTKNAAGGTLDIA